MAQRQHNQLPTQDGKYFTHHSVTIDYPASLPDVLHTTPSAFNAEAKMAMAAKLFEMKRLSSGMAAQLAGVDRVTFLLNLQHYNVAMIDLEEDELMSDFENA